MPPVDATIYRAGLNDLGTAGTQISSGNSRPAGVLLAAANGDITKVTAAANPPASAQVSEPQGQWPTVRGWGPRYHHRARGEVTGAPHAFVCVGAGGGRDVHEETAIVMAGMGLLLTGCGSGAPLSTPSSAPATADAAPAIPAATAAVPGARATRPATAPAAHGPRRTGPSRRPGGHPPDAARTMGPSSSGNWIIRCSTGSELDMGNGVLNTAGRFGAQVALYDIDGILDSAAVVATLRRQGSKVICYIEIGSAGNSTSAAGEGDAVTYYDQLKAAGDLGRALADYPERYLNIEAPSTVPFSSR